jgi:hypothetical protein
MSRNIYVGKVRYDIQNGLDEAPNGLQKLL